ncbi:CD209 antigen-like protein C isoform X2 [Mixophyes fleayi]|uniref:CD209 antigen-like protein C isoform X2 n=1 Tax=Mixophyes fleayi TaxID=3061075 RepID=UPI003F4DF2AF
MNQQGPEDDDSIYTNVDMFRTLPTQDTEDTERIKIWKYGSYRRKDWLVLVALLCLWIILMSIVCAFYSAISGHLEEMKQRNREMNLKLSQANETAEKAQEQLRDKIKEIYDLVRPRCPTGWKAIGPQCYYLSVNTMTWKEAVDICVTQQAQLIILRSKAEMDALLPLFMGQSFWIGLTSSNNSWRWIDGTDLAFSNWSPGEPNNVSGKELCAEIKSNGWNDVDCAMRNNYICMRA